MPVIEGRYFHCTAFEPYYDIKYFDFWRLYYTAFSRVQDLLPLNCNENKQMPSMYFDEIYGGLPVADKHPFNIN
jgi:DNA helicase-2/ATP-dependent DNA helicase PcrA